MTLINEWTAASPRRRLVSLLCDGCDPPRFFVGSEEAAGNVGWNLAGGAEYCPWCRDAASAEGRWTAVSPAPALPNLIIVGAAKAGSTALHAYLNLHPEIAMAEAKELHYFTREVGGSDLERYATHFDGRAPVRGESSPTYAFDPIVGGVPERLHAALPDVRLIYLVRDPVERVVASYVQALSNGWEPLSIEAALADLDDPRNPHVAQSRYGSQLARYLEVFGPESILVLDQAELASDRSAVLRRAFEFARVDPDFTSPEFELMHNTRQTKWRRSPLGKRLRRTAPARLARRLPPPVREAVFAPIRRLTRSGVERQPQLPADLRARLTAELGAELDRLESLVNLRPARSVPAQPHDQAGAGPR